jgi:ribosomal protein L33
MEKESPACKGPVIFVVQQENETNEKKKLELKKY